MSGVTTYPSVSLLDQSRRSYNRGLSAKRSVQVVLGSSTAIGLIEGARAEADLFVMHDCLSCGPLLPIGDVEAWQTDRLAYWRSLLKMNDDDPALPVDDTGKLKAADEIVIWLSTSLADQIALAWLPAFLSALDLDPGRIKMIQFYRSGRGHEILGLGMLNPQQLTAHPAPAALTKSDLAELHLVWDALTAPEPEQLMTYLRSPVERLPFLKRALRSLPLRYPDAISGLNGKEMTLLRQVHLHAPRVPRIIGNALVADYDAAEAGTGGLDQMGDSWLFSRMLRLGDASLPEPALAITGSRVEYRNTEVRMTSFGERVLEGKAGFLDANGIDDWVAGVHLQSAEGRVWLHDRGDLRRR